MSGLSGASFTKDGFRYMIPAVDVTEVYNEGFEDGKKAGGAEECAKKHFVSIIKGTGNTSVSLKVPFNPEMISIVALDQNAVEKAGVNGLMQLFAMPGSNGQRFACGFSTDASGVIYPMQFGTSTMNTRYAVEEDGTITISNLLYGSSGQLKAVFVDGQQYLIVATTR